MAHAQSKLSATSAKAVPRAIPRRMPKSSTRQPPEVVIASSGRSAVKDSVKPELKVNKSEQETKNSSQP